MFGSIVIFSVLVPASSQCTSNILFRLLLFSVDISGKTNIVYDNKQFNIFYTNVRLDSNLFSASACKQPMHFKYSIPLISNFLWIYLLNFSL